MLLLLHRTCFSKPSWACVGDVTQVARLERFSLGPLPKTDLCSLPIYSTLTNSIYRSLNSLPACLLSCLQPTYLLSISHPCFLLSFLTCLLPRLLTAREEDSGFLMPLSNDSSTQHVFTEHLPWASTGNVLASPALVHSRCSVNTC